MNIFIEPKFNKIYEDNPIILVDVGASGAIQENWSHASKHLKTIGFEPDPREFGNLKAIENDRLKYLNVALHDKKEILTYYLTRVQQKSSILKPNMKLLKEFPECDRFDIIKEILIEVDSLDNQFKANDINDADFIKLDTQGSELFILKGAASTINDNIFGMEVEVEFIEMYENQPLFCDVDKYARELGFSLFDVQCINWKRCGGEHIHRKKGQLIFGNALYLRSIDSFCDLIGKIKSVEHKKAKVLKALSICFLYGYFDYALSLHEKVKSVFSVDESKVIDSFIKGKKYFGRHFVCFKGQKTLFKCLNELTELFQPTHGSWATLEHKIGNV